MKAYSMSKAWRYLVTSCLATVALVLPGGPSSGQPGEIHPKPGSSDHVAAGPLRIVHLGILKTGGSTYRFTVSLDTGAHGRTTATVSMFAITGQHDRGPKINLNGRDKDLKIPLDSGIDSISKSVDLKLPVGKFELIATLDDQGSLPKGIDFRVAEDGSIIILTGGHTPVIDTFAIDATPPQAGGKPGQTTPVQPVPTHMTGQNHDNYDGISLYLSNTNARLTVQTYIDGTLDSDTTELVVILYQRTSGGYMYSLGQMFAGYAINANETDVPSSSAGNYFYATVDLKQGSQPLNAGSYAIGIVRAYTGDPVHYANFVVQ